jgi:hypothetical protein
MPRDDKSDKEHRPDDRRFLGGLVGIAGLLAFALFVLPRVVPALEQARQRLRQSIEYAGDSSDSVLVRHRGKAYVEALKKIRETIPQNAAYYFVPAEATKTEHLVRFDLAPRRPVLLEGRPTGPPPPDAPQWVVIARVGAPGPEVFETTDYFRREVRP